MKHSASIPYNNLEFVNPLIRDYYAKKEALTPFYQNNPSLEGLRQAANERQFAKKKRDVLHHVLTGQLGSLTLEPSQKENLKKLLDDNSRTITTGHQLCLFTGPLYTIYKIASTIKLAAKLNQTINDFHFIPIYWLASEDHDIDEVDHANIYGKTLKWNHPKGDAVGRMTLEGIEETIQQLTEILGNADRASEIKELITASYQSDKTLAEATRFLIHELFKEHGLLILDGDDHLLKKQFIPIMSKELIVNIYHDVVNATTDKLIQQGYKKQVNPRKINLFYLHNGYRQRIIKDNKGYTIDDQGKFYSQEEILNLLENHPERFSPNVIMRPLYQETILPNIAYIGGAGELTYWFQLKKGFEHFQLPFPTLILRNSATIVDTSIQKKIDKLQLTTTNLFGNLETLLKSIVLEKTREDIRLPKEKEDLEKLFKKIIDKSGKIDPSVQQFVRGEQKRAIKSIDVIEKKLMQAEKKKQEVELNQIRGLKNKLFPNGGLQERHDNFFQYYIREGENLIPEIINTFDPLSTDHLILFLEA